MRSPSEIIADPNASFDEVLSLSSREQLMHPNCPAERWWTLAVYSPFDAETSSLYAILTTASPDRWVQVEQAIICLQGDPPAQVLKYQAALASLRPHLIRDEVRANVSAIQALGRVEPRWAVRHPNCPVGLWRALADIYPVDAIQNPAQSIYFLDDPVVFGQIEQAARRAGWKGPL